MVPLVDIRTSRAGGCMSICTMESSQNPLPRRTAMSPNFQRTAGAPEPLLASTLRRKSSRAVCFSSRVEVAPSACRCKTSTRFTDRSTASFSSVKPNMEFISCLPLIPPFLAIRSSQTLLAASAKFEKPVKSSSSSCVAAVEGKEALVCALVALAGPGPGPLTPVAPPFGPPATHFSAALAASGVAFSLAAAPFCFGLRHVS
mmetsp:Transcript_54154/g.126447  ORF Transcript_54154/g.126447 Transcript_54154/m.126447 type:complete len:202 (-) Transcript_54154:97-702(-)